jgi:alpha-ketoglutarate-dependent taurine dioxygenase
MLLYEPTDSASITFERVPSDYAILKLVAPPPDAGGDTLWASGYEMYDRLSAPFKALADGLTATHKNVNFNRVAKEQGFELYTAPRGNPENTGNDFEVTQ